MDSFTQNCCVDQIIRVMGSQPDYLHNFLATQNFLLAEDGPLPYEYRHYIAIIAAARHQCKYLVKLNQQEFLLHNGNPQWLKGIAYAPQKIQNLYEVNKILAHQPWLLTKDHIAKLLKGPEPWSLSELMHALILLTHFHSLCSFVYGCSIGIDQDMNEAEYHKLGNSDGENDYASNSDSEDSNSGCYQQIRAEEPSFGCGILIDNMIKLTADSFQDLNCEQLNQQPKYVGRQNSKTLMPAKKNSASEIKRYMIDDRFAYNDFATHMSAKQVRIFRASDYSWDDHGFSLVSRLYAEVGNLLDDKYSFAANMTQCCVGASCDVDSSSFRQAVWNYIHCIYGIKHDDYDYSEVNQVLERNLKAHIKILACYPERLQTRDYDEVMEEFTCSEKVCLNLILMEARQQAQLLYALRAVDRYIT